jgi:hypothetical protein
MLIFGGYDGVAFRNDVWALELGTATAWTKLSPSGFPPSGRTQSAGAHDPARNQLVVFGGFDGGYRDDVWALSLEGEGCWTQVAPAGPLPGRRSGHTVVYDHLRDRVVAYGGFSQGTYYADAWQLPLSPNAAWTQLAPSGPAPTARADHVSVYDPLWDRMTVFSGEPEFSTRTWLLTWGATVGVGQDGRRGGLRWTVGPNPARGRVRLAFELASAAEVRVAVLDVSGRLVRKVVEGRLGPGPHEVWWDGRDGGGRQAAVGVYFCSLRAGDQGDVKRLVLLW